MFDLIRAFDLTAGNWVLLAVGGALIGMTKAGLRGVAILAIPIYATIFGGRPSSGIVLPLLITGDIFAVIYYSPHARWSYVLKLLPWSLTGVILGLIVGGSISDESFTILMAILILVSIGILVYRELRPGEISVPDTWWMAAILGVAAGFTTMIGNAAGSLMTLYLLAMGLPKSEFIGTGAWYFFIVNVLKVPLHAAFWETITWQTLALDLMIVPAILLGAFVGLAIVKRIPEKPYRVFVLVTTFIAAVRLFF
jgi:hypothetical protein